MPTRLTLTFPDPDNPDRPITFECTSGDYDPGEELSHAEYIIYKFIDDFSVDTSINFPLSSEDV